MSRPAGRVLGVRVDRIDYDEAVARIIDAARASRTLRVAAANVHVVMEARAEPELRSLLDQFELVVPDGQPLRWVLNATRPRRSTRLDDRVYGPELMRRVCLAAAREELSVYLYGATADTLRALQRALCASIAPGLVVAGTGAPGFGTALWRDAEQDVERMRASGAQLVLVGLGCPRQELWIGRFASRLAVPCLGLGAAFELWAGRKAMAPHWMQRVGLEWFYRLTTEPRRTWRRYAWHNPRFAALAAVDVLRRRRGDDAR